MVGAALQLEFHGFFFSFFSMRFPGLSTINHSCFSTNALVSGADVAAITQALHVGQRITRDRNHVTVRTRQHHAVA